MTVLSFTTVARHGDARAPGALQRTLKSKALPTGFACAEQVHGHQIVVVPLLGRLKKYDNADGLLTDQPNQPLVIFTADCVPVFLSAAQGQIIGMLHAGWRGTREAILKKAVHLMRRRWGIPAKDVQVWLGPSIGPCCFEVEWDVARYFPLTRRRKKDRWTVDLAQELRVQSRRLGIKFASAKSDLRCTMHHRSFHSYRRDATSKRMASVIMKKS